MWRRRSSDGPATGRSSGWAMCFIFNAGRQGLLSCDGQGRRRMDRNPRQAGVVRIGGRIARSRPQRADLWKSGAALQARSIQSPTRGYSWPPWYRSAVAVSRSCLVWTCNPSQNTLDLQARTMQVRVGQMPNRHTPFPREKEATALRLWEGLVQRYVSSPLLGGSPTLKKGCVSIFIAAGSPVKLHFSKEAHPVIPTRKCAVDA